MSTINGTLSDHTTAISSIEADVTTLQTNEATNEQAIVDMQTTVDAMTADVANTVNLNTDQSTLITANSGNITALQTSVSDIETSVTSHNTTLSNHIDACIVNIRY